MRKTTFWNAKQIQLRAQELADKAEQVWFFPKISEGNLDQYRPVKPINQEYTIEQYEHLKGDILELYKALKQRILNIDSSVTEEYKKLYIAFKASSNFVDIVPQKSKFRLSLNMPYPDIIDPKGLCRDVSSIGRWGNGDVEVGISKLDDIEAVMELIQQAFDIQGE